jgi:Mg-chelatase subunit ChlD
MEITWNPFTPVQWIVTVLCALAFLIPVIRLIFPRPESRQAIWGSRTGMWPFILVAILLTSLLWSLAAWNPIIVQVKDGARPYLALVMDVSQSVTRAEGGWGAVQERALTWLEKSLAAIQPEVLEKGAASLVLVGRTGSTVRADFPLKDLPTVLRKVSERDFPNDTETNLQEGLDTVKKQIDKADGQGVVVLFTDGNETQGDGFAAAARLAQSGVPIDILPLSGSSTAVYLAAADLPVQVAGFDPKFSESLSQQITHLRGVIWNKLNEPAQAELSAQVNAGFKEEGVRKERTLWEKSMSLPGQQWASFSVPIALQGAGLQFVDLSMKTGPQGVAVNRRFFIHVLQPPRILAIGGDNRWAGYYDRQQELWVDMVDQKALTSQTTFDDYDAVVLNNVDGRLFPAGFLDRLAKSVTQDGLGLFFVNGQHPPRGEDDPTLLNSYEGTAIEPILPISVKPRDYTKEPPPRNVVIVIDVSGSMVDNDGGQRLETARRIAAFIIQERLRPVDHLDVLTFTTKAEHISKGYLMDAAGKQRALEDIRQMQKGGGTNATEVVRLVTNLKLANCGLIFISDGEFAPVKQRPDCQGNVFVIGNPVRADFPLDFADPIPIPLGYNPANVVIPYFEPDKRKKYFEPGLFKPASLRTFSPLAATLTFPEALSLDGAAVSYVKEKAELIAVRPKLTDPVLAYLGTGQGMVGAFTGTFSLDWLENEEGRKAILNWLSYTVAYNARDRYVFHVTDLGQALELCVAVVSKEESVPQLSGLEAEIRLPASVVKFAMRRQENEGAFCATAAIPDHAQTLKGTLFLKEVGSDALLKSQRIPILLPPSHRPDSALTREAYSSGTHDILLKSMAAKGGGMYDPPAGEVLFAPRVEQTRSNPLWPWLFLGGAVFYLVAIGLRRLNY